MLVSIHKNAIFKYLLELVLMSYYYASREKDR